MEPILIDVPSRIETKRLVLRVPRAGDGRLVNDAIGASHAELAPWMPWAGSMPSIDESEAHCRRQQARFLLREDNHPPGPVGEPFEHVLLLTDRETSRCYPCPLWTSTPRPTPVASLLFPILSVIGSGSASVRRERTDAERRVLILA